MIERKLGRVYVQFEKKMITLIGKKFITDQGVAVDGRRVRGVLRNDQQINRKEVIQLKSAFNRFFGGDATGKPYTY